MHMITQLLTGVKGRIEISLAFLYEKNILAEQGRKRPSRMGKSATAWVPFCQGKGNQYSMGVRGIPKGTGSPLFAAVGAPPWAEKNRGKGS